LLIDSKHHAGYARSSNFIGSIRSSFVLQSVEEFERAVAWMGHSVSELSGSATTSAAAAAAASRYQPTSQRQCRKSSLIYRRATTLTQSRGLSTQSALFIQWRRQLYGLRWA